MDIIKVGTGKLTYTMHIKEKWKQIEKKTKIVLLLDELFVKWGQESLVVVKILWYETDQKVINVTRGFV